MNKFPILVAVISLSVMVMGSQAAPINSDSTTKNTNTSYSTADINGLLTTAQLHVLHTKQSVDDLEREMVSTHNY